MPAVTRSVDGEHHTVAPYENRREASGGQDGEPPATLLSEEPSRSTAAFRVERPAAPPSGFRRDVACRRER